MATIPLSLSSVPAKSYRTAKPARYRAAKPVWIGPVLGVLFVACTSNNYMGGTHSQKVLTAIWEHVLGPWHLDAIGCANIWMRKVGHFIGHGLLSLVFLKAWLASLRKSNVHRGWWRPLAGALAVLTTLAVASLDEWHQCYVPGRVGSVRDVVIDVSGALAANLIVLAMMTSQRKPRLVSTSRRSAFPLAA